MDHLLAFHTNLCPSPIMRCSGAQLASLYSHHIMTKHTAPSGEQVGIDQCLMSKVSLGVYGQLPTSSHVAATTLPPAHQAPPPPGPTHTAYL